MSTKKPKKPEFHILSVRFPQDEFDILLEAAEKLDTTVSDYVRQAVAEKYTRNLTIFKPLKELIADLERTAVPRGKKKRKVSKADEHLVNVWKAVYEVPGGNRTFWPPILSTLNSLRDEGFTDEDIEDLIRVSVENDWLRVRSSRGDIPPLSTILSSKVVGQLVGLLESKNTAIPDANLEELPLARARAIRSVKGLLGVADVAEGFYEQLDAAESVEQVNSAVEWVINRVEVPNLLQDWERKD